MFGVKPVVYCQVAVGLEKSCWIGTRFARWLAGVILPTFAPAPSICRNRPVGCRCSSSDVQCQDRGVDSGFCFFYETFLKKMAPTF